MNPKLQMYLKDEMYQKYIDDSILHKTEWKRILDYPQWIKCVDHICELEKKLWILLFDDKDDSHFHWWLYSINGFIPDYMKH